ncbi:hypothetical protein TOTORO_00760 [Serratia phage vB_SmaS-Totoro]|nr:hypothetical protein TOTORO_00760 [Serratia phage vB_SmaS-Totoro]
MKKITAVIALSVAMFSSATMARDWTSNWAQGTTEIIQRNTDGSSVNFSCPDESNDGVRTLFIDTADNLRYDSETDNYTIIAKIDGKEVQLNSTLSRVGEANWTYFWEQAAKVKGKTVTFIVPNHKPISFSTAGLKKIANDKDNKSCTTN